MEVKRVQMRNVRRSDDISSPADHTAMKLINKNFIGRHGANGVGLVLPFCVAVDLN